MSVRIFSLGLVLSFCFTLPAQQQRQWQDENTHQLFPPQQRQYCDIFQHELDDVKAHTAATRDAFKAQSVPPIDDAKYGRELEALLGPNHTITNWVGTISISPARERGFASLKFNFSCTSPKEASGENFHSVSTTAFATGYGANEVQSPPLAFSDVVVAKLISLPSHSSMAQVSGQIVYPAGGKQPLSLGNYEDPSPLPAREAVYFRFSRVALPGNPPH